MDPNTLLNDVLDVSDRFAAERAERQQRRGLDPADFQRLHEAGMTRYVLPKDEGGLFEDVPSSTRIICRALRTLARGDSSVALVSSMHPAVLSYWLTAPEEAQAQDDFRQQCREIYDSVADGCWWGTITSEPGSGGDVGLTRTVARPVGSPLEYRLTGQKHFGSGSGVMSFMVTTARPEDEESPDWFFVDMRDRAWDGSQGLHLVAEWDGHGMAATQSHAMRFDGLPATRMAWQGNLPRVSARAGSFIGCLFTSVIVGIVDAAIEAATAKLDSKPLKAFEQVEWARARMEAWLIDQALEGMVRAIETQPDPRQEVLQGKTAVAELAETVMTRLCKTIGGGTFARHSPFGFWFEDVRALGFLRPPWSLAVETLIQGFPDVD